MKYNRTTSTAELETAVEAYWYPNPFPNPDGFTRGFVRALMPHCAKTYGGYPSENMTIALMRCAEELYEQEELPQIEFERKYPTTPIGTGAYRDLLFYLVSFAEHDPQAIIADFVSRTLECFDHFLGALPHYAFFPAGGAQLDPDTPSIPFLDITGDKTHHLIDDLIQPLLSSEPYGLFQPFRAALEENSERVFKGELIPPRNWRGQSKQSVKAYLEGTPLYDLLFLDIPEPQPAQLPDPGPQAPVIEEIDWHSHAMLIAAPGQGKTNAIRWRIAQVLPQIAKGTETVVLMEPKGVLTDEIIYSELAWELRERLIIIDPNEPVAVNLFHKGDGSPIAINDSIDRIERIFNALSSDLTAMQRGPFRFVLRALFSLSTPPTMRAFKQILRRGIADFPPEYFANSVQEYFQYDWKRASERASEIIDRLNNLLGDPIFEALFDSEHTTFDMFQELQNGKLIIINASAASSGYARFWIEEVCRCIRPRFRIPKDQRVPVSFIIDEAQNYISKDHHFAQILDEAREAKIGIFVAAHHMEQIVDLHVRNSLYNCNLKFIAQTHADIHNLCRSMGITKPEFVETMPKHHFAFFGPNMRQAEMVNLGLVEFDKLDRMSAEQYAELRRVNRARYADQEVVATQKRFVEVMAPIIKATAEAVSPAELSAVPPPGPASPDQPRPAATGRDTSQGTEAATDFSL